jgi:hypothetical protein
LCLHGAGTLRLAASAFTLIVAPPDRARRKTIAPRADIRRAARCNSK